MSDMDTLVAWFDKKESAEAMDKYTEAASVLAKDLFWTLAPGKPEDLTLDTVSEWLSTLTNIIGSVTAWNVVRAVDAAVEDCGDKFARGVVISRYLNGMAEVLGLVAQMNTPASSDDI